MSLPQLLYSPCVNCKRTTALIDGLCVLCRPENALAESFRDADAVLDSLHALEGASGAEEAEWELQRLVRNRADDAATYPHRSEADDLDELIAGLRASARAAVWTHPSWATRMAEAAEAIEHLRNGR